MKIPRLSDLLNFNSNELVGYFAHKNDISTTASTTLLRDLLGWMWLTLHRKTKGKATHLFGPLLVLDEFWHCFILHTRLYQQFCNTYFDEFFHHDIEPLDKGYVLEAAELADFLSDCLNFLGEEWVDRYFADYYSDAAIANLELG